MLEWRQPTMDEAMEIGPEIMAPEIFKPSGLDVAAATFRIENPIASWVEGLNYRSEEADVEGYNPYEGLDPKYLPFSEAFHDARSPDQRRMLEARIDMQIADRETMALGGAKTVGWALAAGLGDPINLPLMLIPAARIGAGIAETAATVGATGAVAAGLSESLLHATQPTRTWQETMLAMGATTLLGGALGGLAGAGTKRTIKALDDATKDIEDIVKNGGLQEVPQGSAGAARVVGTVEEEGTKGLGPAFNPLLRLFKSKSGTAINTINEMARHNFFIGKNRAGRESTIPVDVEITRMQQGLSARYIRTMREQYMDMLGAKTFTGARLSKGMKFREFAEEVGKAMRRGDAHDVPQVAATARKLRSEVINPITKGFQELGDLPASLETKFAKSYLPRVYNTARIEKNLGEWLELLERHFVARGEAPVDAKDIAAHITRNILGSPNGRLPVDMVGSTGRLKERVLDIEDEVLDSHGFLVNNVDQVLQTYMRSTVPELQLKTRFGDHDLKGVLDNVQAEYQVLIDKAESNSVKGKLSKQRDRDVEDIEAVRDILLGRYLMPTGQASRFANMARLVRGLSFMANLGMMTVSAIPDLARPVMQHGAKAWAKALPRGLLYFGKSTKLARRQLEEMGIGVDNVLNSRIYALAEMEEIGTGLERWTRTFAKFSGMNHWNSVMKKIAAFTAQNRFIDDSINFGSLSARRQERLAKAGISEDMANRIAEQTKAHGEKLGGGWHANTADWTDRVAAEHFERVLLRDVDNTIVTPGAADRPLFMSSEMGKTILQFRTFFLAAHNQVFLPLGQQLARQDMAALQGIMTGISLGMMGEWIRLNLSGRGDELEGYSMQDWVRAGLDRSGLATVPMELFNMADRMAYGRLTGAMGLTEGSRYFYRNWFGTLAGPAVGYAQDIGELAQNLLNSDGLSERDIHAIRRLAPYQNIFYLRRLIDQMEAEVVKQTGAKPSRRTRGNAKPIYIR